ncbi:MAG: Succinate dehydrogenase cytochrome b556 subunit [Pseudomonadota bacterium]|jgi:succinate dehydrogenase / fumarate reductase cytochrome b subunit
MNHRQPLSPHLQIYRLPLTALLSIAHRITGCLLLTAWIAIVLCLIYLALGREDAWQTLHLWGSSPAVRIVISGWLFALSLHAVHGIRHLLWDMGFGFERGTIHRLAQAEAILALIFTGYLASGLW